MNPDANSSCGYPVTRITRAAIASNNTSSPATPIPPQYDYLTMKSVQSHITIPPETDGPLITSPLAQTFSQSLTDGSVHSSPILATSPPISDGPLDTSLSNRDAIPPFKDNSPSTRAYSPPLPNLALHTTRSDSSGSNSEDEDSEIQKPIKNDVRGSCIKQEITKKRKQDEALGIVTDKEMKLFQQDMLRGVEEEESPTWSNTICKWEPSYQSRIPSWDKSRLPSESDEDDDLPFQGLKEGQGGFHTVAEIHDIPDEGNSLGESSHGVKQDDKDMWNVMEKSEEGEENVKMCFSHFVKEFEVESTKPTAIVGILSINEMNEHVKHLNDKDEVLIVNRRCMVRTTKEGIEKARRDWEEECDNEMEFGEEDISDVVSEEGHEFEDKIINM